MMTFMWKILEERDGKPFFMMKGLDGTREIELDNILTAERKLVRDGSGKTEYLSGFHCCGKLTDMIDYAQRFTNTENRVVCRVLVDSYERKPTENSLAFLATRMRLRTTEWKRRVPLSEIKELQANEDCYIYP
jgi:hypothetical protein